MFTKNIKYATVKAITYQRVAMAGWLGARPGISWLGFTQTPRKGGEHYVSQKDLGGLSGHLGSRLWLLDGASRRRSQCCACGLQHGPHLGPRRRARGDYVGLLRDRRRVSCRGHWHGGIHRVRQRRADGTGWYVDRARLRRRDRR
jgi:hypothetical protein